jgi:hypothetical protein
MEAVQILVFPFMLVFATWLLTAAGWIQPEHAPVIWDVVAVTVIASLLAMGAVYIIEK